MKIPYLLEFDETPRFWYPHVALIAWIDFTFCSYETDSPIFLDLRDKRKPFFFFSLSLSSAHFLPFLFSIFFPFLLSYLPNFLFVCSHPHFFLIFLFLIYFFFLFFIFLFFFSHTQIDQSGGDFPPLSSFATCHPHIFFPYFSYFPFFLFPSLDTWLNVSHSHKCTTWLMPCVTPLGFHVASTWSFHVSPDTRCLEECEILTVSESNKIQLGN